MGRSKEMGKPVEALTVDELRRELVRVRTHITYFKSHHTMRKRLAQIQARLAGLKGGSKG